MAQSKILIDLIEGEIPPSNLLLMGPPGTGKTIFGENMVCEALLKGAKCLYITLDRPPNEVRRSLLIFGVDNKELEAAERFVLFDGYTWISGRSTEPYNINNLTNLSELIFRVSDAAAVLGEGMLLVMDSVSTLLTYNNEGSILKFLQVIMARVKEWHGVGLYVAEHGVHSEGFYNSLRFMVDGVLEMKMYEIGGELRRFFRVHTFKMGAHNTSWIPFSIGQHREFVLGKGFSFDDFTQMKDRMTIDLDGTLSIHGTRFCLERSSTFADLTETLLGLMGKDNAQSVLYEIGKQIGDKVVKSFMVENLGYTAEKLLDVCLKDIQARGWGNFVISEFNEESGFVRIRYYNPLVGTFLVGQDGPADSIVAGMISVIVNRVSGKKNEIAEIRCVADGNPYCEFVSQSRGELSG